MSNKEAIIYWFNEAQKELGCFLDDTAIRYCEQLDKAGLLVYKELENRSGVVAYSIANDFCGNKCVNEVFMYIKPEHRGNPRNILNIVKIMEDAARENDCKYVCIGSNIGYKDEKVLSALQRLGYKLDCVKKALY